MALDDKEITRRLFAAASAVAKRHNVEFGDGASGDVRRMAETATGRIREGVGSKSPEAAEEYIKGAVRVGREAMRTFVEQMVLERTRIPGYVAARGAIIGEDTWKRAKAVLCPLWPIC